MQVLVERIEKRTGAFQRIDLLLAGLLRDLAYRGRSIRPGLMQVLARQAEQGQVAVELQRVTQVHPVLLDMARLRVGELKAPRQAQTAAALAQRDDGGQMRLDEKPLVAAGAAVVQPVDVQLLFIQQQPWRQQRAEQGAELAKPLQRLFEVAGVGQGKADIAVVPGQQALAEQKAAVRST